MSIRVQIQIALDAGWLVNFLPRLPSSPHKRVIFITNRLYEELQNEFFNDETSERTGQLLETLERFLSGDLITVGYGTKNEAAYMKRLNPQQDEIWEIRSVDPKPSIRVFGRFADKDVFVATNKELRQNLGGYKSHEFEKATALCKQEWRRCFQNWQPHRGNTVNDYISEHVRDLRDL